MELAILCGGPAHMSTHETLGDQQGPEEIFWQHSEVPPPIMDAYNADTEITMSVLRYRRTPHYYTTVNNYVTYALYQFQGRR